MPVQSQKILLKVSDGTEVQCYVSKPAELSPSVGLIVFQEAFGVNHHMRSVTDRFAEHGYLAICPELFHRTAPVGLELAYDNFQAVMPYYQALTDAGLEADGKACFDWLIVGASSCWDPGYLEAPTGAGHHTSTSRSGLPPTTPSVYSLLSPARTRTPQSLPATKSNRACRKARSVSKSRRSPGRKHIVAQLRIGDPADVGSQYRESGQCTSATG